MDSKWYGETRFMLAALALVVGLAVILGGAYAFKVAADRGGQGTSNQCDLPLAQRSGGWVCP